MKLSWLNDYLMSNPIIQLPFKGEVHSFKHPIPRIVCKDGTTLSVQAGKDLYCIPRTQEGPWTHVEVGYPDAMPPITWQEHSEEPDGRGVYSRVPIELVYFYIGAHGGVDEEEMAKAAKERAASSTS